MCHQVIIGLKTPGFRFKTGMTGYLSTRPRHLWTSLTSSQRAVIPAEAGISLSPIRPRFPPVRGNDDFRSSLYVYQEVNYVAILDLIRLALRAERPFLAALGGATAAAQVIVGNNLGADEAPHKVGVDSTPAASWAGMPLGTLQALHLVRADGQEGNKAQGAVAGAESPGPWPNRPGPGRRGIPRPPRRALTLTQPPAWR